MSERTAYPLSWPDGWKRMAPGLRTSAKFSNYGNQLSIADAVQRLIGELGRMGVPDRNVIVSTNVEPRLDGMPRSDARVPIDPGAAVYWKKNDKQLMRCMAIDRYIRVADNLAAIAATLEAMRAIERHGGATILDRAFLGFAALPQKASQHWREVLGIQGQATIDLVESRFKALAKLRHPDVGGTDDAFIELQQAKEAALLELSA